MTAFSDVVILMAIIGGIANVGASAAVAWTYWRALTALRRQRGFRPAYGLLVWHVVSIALAWSGMWALLVLGLLEQRGVFSAPRPVRLTGYVFVAVLGLVALWLIATETRRRVQRPATCTTVTETTATVLHDGDDTPPPAH